MDLPVGPIVEPFATVFTLVQVLLGVQLQVPLQCVRIAERASAGTALKSTIFQLTIREAHQLLGGEGATRIFRLGVQCYGRQSVVGGYDAFHLQRFRGD
uniref:Putative secreted peptide n=1 Tax=Anopheles braziliensis TaxID=58242 RepID=A0A2M3ZXK8_9DIPT